MESPEQIVAQLSAIYDAAVACLRDDISAFAREGTLPPPERRRDVRDVEPGSYGLVALRKEPFDCDERGLFHEADEDRRREHLDLAAAHVRRGIPRSDDDFGGAGEPRPQIFYDVHGAAIGIRKRGSRNDLPVERGAP